ncbi:META domain-containing protein [uncultured Helicobacter sp.]|uniref:META domain-containing protein n=1 Tax=uncultured Helicobacter sp. TaxID=175537 RepID=UPI00258F2B2E|nr:META domain-containing protein [uncultured Helicobacter sp.]
MKNFFQKFIFHLIALALCLDSGFAFQSLVAINAYSLMLESRWEVESMQMGEYEFVIPNDVENAYLTFSQSGSGQNNISGIVGCNNYLSSFEIQGNGKYITILPGVLSKKMCDGIAMNIETIFTKHFVGGFVVMGDEESITLVGKNFKIRLVPSLFDEP